MAKEPVYGWGYNDGKINRTEAKHMVGPGWSGLIDKLFDALIPGAHIIDIKEKWGTLRIDAFNITTELDDLIDTLEHDSGTICEICGEPGKSRDLPWVQTLCELHYQMELDRLRDVDIDNTYPREDAE